jgi:hypothetical protein
MRSSLLAVLVSGLFLAACDGNAAKPSALANPVSPTAVSGSGSDTSATENAEPVAVPFHAEVVWQKIEGSDVALCTRQPPAGMVYKQHNAQYGTAVATHLGTADFEGHTCVYGPPAGGPAGWLGEVRWTAANGDVLLTTSEFLNWTGTPGKSVAMEHVTFQGGGTGRFQFATGEASCAVNAPARTATYDGLLRYGKKEK